LRIGVVGTGFGLRDSSYGLRVMGSEFQDAAML